MPEGKLVDMQEFKLKQEAKRRAYETKQKREWIYSPFTVLKSFCAKKSGDEATQHD